MRQHSVEHFSILVECKQTLSYSIEPQSPCRKKQIQPQDNFALNALKKAAEKREKPLYLQAAQEGAKTGNIKPYFYQSTRIQNNL